MKNGNRTSCLKSTSEKKSHLYEENKTEVLKRYRYTLYYCTWIKYAVQGSIILRLHKVKRRQTQRTNPQIVFILDSKHSSGLKNIQHFLNIQQELFSKIPAVSSTHFSYIHSLHSKSCSSLMYSSVSHGGTSVTP